MRDFLAALVHELRTPLTALRGSLGLLGSALPDEAVDAREFHTIATRNASRLVGLLDDLAAFARLQSPELVIASDPVDLELLLERTVVRVMPVANERGVMIDLRPTSGVVTGDEALLVDAAARMLFYAVRVTPREGTVVVGADASPSGGAIEVIDQGRPVGEADAAGIFTPFSAVARRGVDSAGRAALDLAIARLVAERHGGALEFHQVEGGGLVRLRVGPRESIPD